MADKADPSQELHVTMGAGYCCRFVGRKCAAVSRLSQSTTHYGLNGSLLLRDGSAMGDAAAPSRVTLGDALPAVRINVEALDGGLRGVLETFLLAAL